MESRKKVDSLTQWDGSAYVPHVSIDLVIFGFHDGQLKVLLLHWRTGTDWLLPSGFIHHDENMDDAAHRSLRERTGLQAVFLQQFHTFGEAIRFKHFTKQETMIRLGFPGDRDEPLFRRHVSIGYYALVEFSEVVPTPDQFTDECRWWDVDEVPPLLFDHNDMIKLALKTLRRQLSYQPIGYNLLPEKFTMPELQRLYETILGQPLDRRNFQKRIVGYAILERLEERKTGGAHKAPYLYRFDTEKYAKVLEEGMSFVG